MYIIDINLGRYQILGSVSIYTATFMFVIQVAICPQAILSGTTNIRLITRLPENNHLPRN